jgi:transcriptional regulator of nitric oxide reductase
VRQSPPAIALTALLLVAAGLVLGAQAPNELLDKRLRKLFPAAASFGSKGGSPPHYKAFTPNPSGGEPIMVGYAFLTTDLEPLESGYDGPIQMLVGINPKGVLAGIVVTAHREPYGYFSVDPPEFAAQFANKDVRDPFKVGQDVEAISRATITINSATRAIRNSARRFARAMLAPPPPRP